MCSEAYNLWIYVWDLVSVTGLFALSYVKGRLKGKRSNIFRLKLNNNPLK